MENIKKGLLAVAAVLAGVMCMGGMFSLTVLLRYADFKQGKAIIIVIFLLMIAGFGMLSFKCFKSVFRKKGMPKSEKVVNFTVEEQMPDFIEERYVQSVDETPENPVVEKETENNTVFGVPVEEIKIMPREEPQEASQFDKTEGFNREKYHSTNNKNHTSEGFKAINAQAYADAPNTHRTYVKCNCDGCPKQDKCEYGHVVYDEITNERMALYDKFMMLHTFDCDISEENFGDIATIHERHDKRLLMKLDINILHNTLNYLQEVKRTYYSIGKCGRSYFNFMTIGDEISLVKEAIKDYKSYQEIANDSEDSKNKVLEKNNIINLQDYADVQQEYDFLVCHVRYSRTLHDNILFSFEEEVFFKALIKEMKENKLWNKEGLRLTRLADYTFNVDCHTCYIGKVKLRNKMFIQVQRGSSQIKKYNISELSEVLDKIPAWIRYIKYCRRN